MLTRISKIAPRLLQRLLNNSSYPSVELVYESIPHWPLGLSESQSPKLLRISVLDSSFNPPTLAHLGLANTHLPLEWAKDVSPGSQESVDYDAHLLLLSVKNADKTLKPTDASYLQRLEMMSLLTKRMSSTNVAIAITNQATFVCKSKVLLAFLNQKILSFRTQPSPTIELTFLVGLDTLERIFSPRYYPSETEMKAALQKFLSSAPEGDNSRILAGQRIFIPTASQSVEETSTLVKHYLDSGRIAIVDNGEELSALSSTAVRSAVARDGLTTGDKARLLWHDCITTEIAKYIVEEQLYATHWWQKLALDQIISMPMEYGISGRSLPRFCSRILSTFPWSTILEFMICKYNQGPFVMTLDCTLLHRTSTSIFFSLFPESESVHTLAYRTLSFSLSVVKVSYLPRAAILPTDTLLRFMHQMFFLAKSSMIKFRCQKVDRIQIFFSTW